MAERPKIKRKIATVELADGTVHEAIRIIWADTANYQRTAERHGWPHMTVKDGVGTVPHLNREEPFTVWSALKRLTLYAGTWEDFEGGDCIAFMVDEEDVDPTGAAPMPPAGSDSSLRLPASIRDSQLVGSPPRPPTKT